MRRGASPSPEEPVGSEHRPRKPIPRDGRLDSSIAFRRDPYDYLSKECDRLGTDVFEARLLLRPAIFVRGEGAAAMFYDQTRLRRRGAAPRFLQKTLFGVGGVQGLDGTDHRARKALLLACLSGPAVDKLVRRFHEQWQDELPAWAGEINVYDAIRPILARSVCDWAGVPVPARDLKKRTHQLTMMYAGAGSIGPDHVRARLARRGAERWLAALVRVHRRDHGLFPANSAADLITRHREGGDPLPPRVAAVEILNILRPTVAVSVYITHLAHALHLHPPEVGALSTEESRYAYVDEVRRLYPFFPAVIARVVDRFEWNGYVFPRGRRVVLGLHATTHHGATWPRPESFCPHRHVPPEGNDFSLIPQGGGDVRAGHRCAGETLARRLMHVALEFFVDRIRWIVPHQDLVLDLRRLPAMTPRGFRIRVEPGAPAGGVPPIGPGGR